MGISSPITRGEFDGGVEVVIGDLEETVKWAVHAGQLLAVGYVFHSLQAHACVLHGKPSQL